MCMYVCMYMCSMCMCSMCMCSMCMCSMCVRVSVRVCVCVCVLCLLPLSEIKILLDIKKIYVSNLHNIKFSIMIFC